MKVELTTFPDGDVIRVKGWQMLPETKRDHVVLNAIANMIFYTKMKYTGIKTDETTHLPLSLGYVSVGILDEEDNHYAKALEFEDTYKWFQDQAVLAMFKAVIDHFYPLDNPEPFVAKVIRDQYNDLMYKLSKEHGNNRYTGVEFNPIKTS